MKSRPSGWVWTIQVVSLLGNLTCLILHESQISHRSASWFASLLQRGAFLFFVKPLLFAITSPIVSLIQCIASRVARNVFAFPISVLLYPPLAIYDHTLPAGWFTFKLLKTWNSSSDNPTPLQLTQLGALMRLIVHLNSLEPVRILMFKFGKHSLTVARPVPDCFASLHTIRPLVTRWEARSVVKTISDFIRPSL